VWSIDGFSDFGFISGFGLISVFGLTSGLSSGFVSALDRGLILIAF
jgi:hypothetical protein